MPTSHWFAIACGGALGAVLRHWCTLQSARLGLAPFLGTLAVNVAGCLVIGWLLAWSERTGALSTASRQMWVVGALGAFTTYSTFAVDAFELVRNGRPWFALLNVVLHLGLGGAALLLGRAAAA